MLLSKNKYTWKWKQMSPIYLMPQQHSKTQLSRLLLLILPWTSIDKYSKSKSCKVNLIILEFLIFSYTPIKKPIKIETVVIGLIKAWDIVSCDNFMTVRSYLWKRLRPRKFLRAFFVQWRERQVYISKCGVFL